jgi:hypothetical protein
MSTVAVHRPRLRVTPARVVKSEWIKFWSLRSTVVTLVVAVALLVGIGLLASSLFDNPTAGPGAGGPGGSGSNDPVSASLAGVTFAELAFGTLGVLFMAGEYGTGMIRSSLAAVPKRLLVLWSKIAVFAGVVFVVALAGSVIAFTGGQALIGSAGASWSDPGVARAVLGTAVVLTGSGVLGIGLGALMRSTAAAISTLVGGLFLLTGIASLLVPDSWSTVLEYLPANAATAFTAVTRASDALGPWSALAVFLAYIAAVTIAAARRLKRSDA